MRKDHRFQTVAGNIGGDVSRRDFFTTLGALAAGSLVFGCSSSTTSPSLSSVPQPSAPAASADPLALDGVPPVVASAPVTAASTLDEPIEQIAGTADGCAVLDKDFPGLRSHPMYGFFKTMSLHQIAAMSRGKITSDMLTQAQTDLSALPPEATPFAASMH